MLKVIIKQPTEPYGHILHIQNRLDVLQHLVGGPIEVIQIQERPTVLLICNEEGKLKRLKANLRALSDVICGTVVICGADGAEFADIPITFPEWMQLLEDWGNI